MLKYKDATMDSVDDCLEKYSKKEFKSPYRSTIPLLILFKQNKNLLRDLIAKQVDSNTDYIFEFEAPARIGTGLPSCTDLMIVNDESCIAIEAKRTEPKYQTVKEWLDGTVNKENVLDGWLSYIQDKTNILLTVEQILNFPYQMIHRVASACSLQKKTTIVLYIGFDLTNSMHHYYQSKLSDLSILLGNKIQMEMICFDIQKTGIQYELEKMWNNGSRDLSVEVKSGIVKNNLMSFTS